MAKKTTREKQLGSLKPVKRAKKKQPSGLSGPRKFSQLSLKEQEQIFEKLTAFCKVVADCGGVQEIDELVVTLKTKVLPMILK